MRAVVTGSEGLLGSAVVSRLSKYYEVVALDATSAGARTQAVDIRDSARVRALLRPGDTVVHLAGVLGKPSNENPVESVDVNGLGTALLLKECCEAGVARFVLGSSVAVYGADHKYGSASLPLTESAPRHLSSDLRIYAATKLLQEELAVHAASSSGLQVRVVRLGVVLGYRPTGKGSLPFVSEWTVRADSNMSLDVPQPMASLPILSLRRAAEIVALLAETPMGNGRSVDVYNAGGSPATLLELASQICVEIGSGTVRAGEGVQTTLAGLPTRISDEKLIAELCLPPAELLQDVVRHMVAEYRRMRESSDPNEATRT